MKKILSFLLVMFMGLTLAAGCKDKEKEPTTLDDVNAFLNDKETMNMDLANTVAIIPFNHINGPKNEWKFYALVNFQYKERGKNVWLIKPDVDTREELQYYNGKVVKTLIRSRVGIQAWADAISPTDKLILPEGTTSIICDEAQFLTKEQVEELKIFADEKDIPAWAKDYIAILKNAGFMNGYPDNTIQPGGNLTRAEAVTMLFNIY